MLQTGFASNPRNGPSARSCASAPIAVFLMLAFLIAGSGTLQAQIAPAGETHGAAAIVSGIMQDLETFSGGRPADDDQALLLAFIE